MQLSMKRVIRSLDRDQLCKTIRLAQIRLAEIKREHEKRLVELKRERNKIFYPLKEVQFLLRRNTKKLELLIAEGKLKPYVVFGSSKFFEKVSVDALREKEEKLRLLKPSIFPKVNLHLTREDCTVPSLWWAQAAVVKKSLEAYERA